MLVYIAFDGNVGGLHSLMLFSGSDMSAMILPRAILPLGGASRVGARK